ncbi:MAG: response regulator transcription factor [Chitinophagaceae bacterium]|nr:response regulator transcription factor [Chitinophagaceae bacterium]MCW5913027.1 response regulator transcription factor [Chitinophagaceae bacterium]MCZ2395169.1 response regulator transcription factor [Chitinophagales bacterium]
MKSPLLPLNILVADDHRLITDGISKLIEGEAMIGDVITAQNGQEAVDIVLESDIDCVIMDINMPVLNGLEATRIIKKEKPFVKVIVVSMLSDASIVSKMLKAGADGFLNKDTGKEELLKALERVSGGEKYVSTVISNNLLTHLSDPGIQSQEAERPLSPREIEIVKLIAEGLTNKEIAGRLFLSTVTVDTHRKNILAKLHLRNTASLVKYAVDHKLL